MWKKRHLKVCGLTENWVENAIFNVCLVYQILVWYCFILVCLVNSPFIGHCFQVCFEFFPCELILGFFILFIYIWFILGHNTYDIKGKTHIHIYGIYNKNSHFNRPSQLFQGKENDKKKNKTKQNTKIKTKGLNWYLIWINLRECMSYRDYKGTLLGTTSFCQI